MIVDETDRLDTIMVVLADRISDIIAKGEIIDRYYNPGNLFRTVHFVVLNDDLPNTNALQRQAGTAQIHVHNFPSGKGLFIRTCGWRLPLLQPWAKPIINLARNVNPGLVRTYDARLQGLVARLIWDRLRIPYVISLHTNPQTDHDPGLKASLIAALITNADRRAAAHAALVMPVYSDLMHYSRGLMTPESRIHYNVINATGLQVKEDYTLAHPPRVVTVGRQFDRKNPSNIIRAMALIPGVHLTVIGDGPLHDRLVDLTAGLGLTDRVEFIRSLSNDSLISELPSFDIFAVHNQFWGVPKTVMEAMLAGLPVVHNLNASRPVEELSTGAVHLVEDTAEGYARALQYLINDPDHRAQLGRRAREIAKSRWDHEAAETAFVASYRKIASGTKDHPT